MKWKSLIALCLLCSTSGLYAFEAEVTYLSDDTPITDDIGVRLEFQIEADYGEQAELFYIFTQSDPQISESITFKRDYLSGGNDSDSLILSYRYVDNQNSIDIRSDYKVLDEVFSDSGRKTVTMYITKDFMWFESHEDNGLVQEVYPSSVFFGARGEGVEYVWNNISTIASQIESITPDSIVEYNLISASELREHIHNNYSSISYFPLQDWSNNFNSLYLISSTNNMLNL